MENVDRKLADALPRFDEDATVILMGDDGENLEEDPFRHGKLYDTQVRVPLFVRWVLDGKFGRPRVVRQQNLAPTVAKAATVSAPPTWQGEPLPKERPRQTYMVHNARRLDRVFVEHRTESGKRIASLDFHTGVERSRE